MVKSVPKPLSLTFDMHIAIRRPQLVQEMIDAALPMIEEEQVCECLV